MAHDDQPGAMSKGIVDGGLHAGLWHGAAVLPRPAPVTMADGLSLTRLLPLASCQLSVRRAGLLLVPDLPASDDPAERHLVPGDETAARCLDLRARPYFVRHAQSGVCARPPIFMLVVRN
jgi:hypothetical protein